MKSYSVFPIVFCLVLIVSCNNSSFKETKIAVAPASSSPAQTMPQDMSASASPASPSSSELPPGHPAINKEAPANEMPAAKIENLKKVSGGVTVEECFKNKSKLNGKSVSLRAKVVKYSGGILKRNWLHVQDGSGAKGQNDLVVTTSDIAKVNDIVIVTGTLHYDKDIGSGYFFPAIIEDAKIKLEK